MPVIIDANLTEPPSSVTCFRDVTLYVDCFVKKNVVIECEPYMKDLYWRWLKRAGAFDFVADIVEPFEEKDFSIRRRRGSISVDLINEYNLNFILSSLGCLRRQH